MIRTLHALERRLADETAPDLALTMWFPTSWDPYFTSAMTVLEVYEHHRRQLTLATLGSVAR